MEPKHKRGNFTGSIGFVLAAAGSAVGLGNIWRFPYLAAKDGGGVFLLCYLVLALTFGFTLLTTEIAIGRKTGQSPLTAYRFLHRSWGWLGVVACLVPVIILPYYCTIGGWVLKYLATYLSGGAGAAMADGYFTGFITSTWSPIIWFIVFLGATMLVVYKGVDTGIERFSKVLMPILLVLILAIAVFSLTLTHTDSAGNTRTGFQGLLVYLVPDFSGITAKSLLIILMDAMGQLFFSISVAMGIMVAYGSYVKKETNLVRSVNQIEIFDTVVAFLAGLMIVPAVFTFMGTEGMNSGPSLMFVSLPKVFGAMGKVGVVVGAVFFLMVAFAALTSSVSVMEAIVSSIMDKFRIARKKATLGVTALALVAGIIVCLGYNLFYFELMLPNSTTPGQILDLLDYASNYILMPVVAISTCILIGWVVKPKTVIDEVTLGGCRFGRKSLYVVMVKVVTPLMLFFLLLQSLGLLRL
ncbi:sodium-dependent transporter [uncultured Flavonifractor sp.]|uniref:sodium-dependent transporter n=1 Tax=uncultured Flavonifractor sp. TaxID=1193534 RepID=UPI002637A9AE|nr:sodium-dependent transporter [uncultured Flavonifractor sp.]